MSYSADGHGMFSKALDEEDRGRLREAETAYRQALVLFQEQPDTGREQSACHYNLGNLYLTSDRNDKALASFEQAAEVFPRGDHGDQQLARTHLVVGSLLLEADRFAEAEGALLDALGQYLDVEDPDAQDMAACHVNLGQTYRRTDRPSQAITAFNRALDFYQTLPGSAQDQAECYTFLGGLYENSGKLQESGAAYATAARLRAGLQHGEDTGASSAPES